MNSISKNKKIKNLSYKNIKHLYSRWDVYKNLTKPHIKDDLIEQSSLVFMGQGLNTQELTELRTVFNSLGLNLKKISRKTWFNSLVYQKNKTIIEYKAKNKFYGDLFLLSALKNYRYNKITNNDHMINYIYKQLVNFYIYQQKSNIWDKLATKNDDNLLNALSNAQSEKKTFKTLIVSSKERIFDQILDLSSQHISTQFAGAPWELNALGKGKNEIKMWFKENYIPTLFKVILENNLIYTGLVKQKNNINSTENSNIYLKLENFNPELYTDYDCRKLLKGLKNSEYGKNFTPYDLILQKSITNFDAYNIKVDGLNLKFISFL